MDNFQFQSYTNLSSVTPATLFQVSRNALKIVVSGQEIFADQLFDV